MRRIVAVLAFAALTGAACGGSQEPAGNGAEADGQTQAQQPPAECVDLTGEAAVEITINANRGFDPSCVVVSADQEFNVQNDDEQGHSLDVGVKEYHRGPFLLSSERMVPGAATTAGPLGPEAAPGFYPLFCRYHIDMKGELFVA